MGPTNILALFRPLILALVLLLGQGAQVSYAGPLPVGSILADDTGWDAHALTARSVTVSVKAESPLPVAKAALPGTLLSKPLTSWRKVTPAALVSSQVPLTPFPGGFDARGPPLSR